MPSPGCLYQIYHQRSSILSISQLWHFSPSPLLPPSSKGAASLLDHCNHLFPQNHSVAAAAAKSLQSCPTLCVPIDGSPPGFPSLGFSRQEQNTGMGCHFLLQCKKVKSESEVAQSCPTLSDLMDSSLPGSSVHGIFQARVLEWGAIAFSTKSL